MSGPLPPEEALRLQGVNDFETLNLQDEPALDRLTALAARLFHVPIALISLVGRDKQWFVGRHGVDICETSRGISFCAHAIMPSAEKVFVVKDTLLDPRFVHNALVVGDPHIRFYAGAPLRLPNGQPIGSLCVIDRSPRSFSAEDGENLSDLAAAAMSALQLRLMTLRQDGEINARIRAQAELENSHGLLRAIIDGTDNAVFIKDLESRYLLINPAGARMLGSTPSEVAGKTDESFFPPESARQIRATDLEIMASGVSRTFESIDVISGEEHVFLSTKSPYRDVRGKLLGVIGISRVVTEQRRAAEAVHAAKEEAERANRAKSEFLSRMSHELRTPLNAILGFGQLLEMAELGPRLSESVEHILKGGRHLLNLIDEVLTVSRIEAGKMAVSLEPVAVCEMVGECLALVRPQAADRGIECGDECSAICKPDELYVMADRQRLRQVLLNLLSNGVKYNRPAGQLTLSCRRLTVEEGDRLRIEVRDRGAGLTPEQIGRLFAPFERLDAEDSRIEGTGLGLAVSRGLMHAMQGTIGVESVPGEGSVFWVELPIVINPLIAAESAFQPEPAEHACRGCVLYIEDNLSNLRLIELLFSTRPNLELLSAQQGSLGLEMARARRPDVILLDLHLPDINGHEVLALLQADPATRPIPTIVISADATPNQIERVLHGGAAGYLTKPINISELMEKVLANLENG